MQIPGTYPDDEDNEQYQAIQKEHAAGNYDLHRSLFDSDSLLVMEEAKLESSCWFNSSMKTQRVILKTRQNTPPNIESKLQKLQYTHYPESIIVFLPRFLHF